MKLQLLRQQGATLLIGLIMLILLTLLAVTSFKLGKGSLQAVSNMQHRNQTAAAAQGAIEQVISSVTFVATPANAIPSPCGGVPNKTCVDVAGKGVRDVTVAVTPKCVAVQTIPVDALDFSKPNDAGCLVGAGQNFGVVGAASNNSMCADSLWDIQAVASDPVTNAQSTINQGVAVRVPVTTVCP